MSAQYPHGLCYNISSLVRQACACAHAHFAIGVIGATVPVAAVAADAAPLLLLLPLITFNNATTMTVFVNVRVLTHSQAHTVLYNWNVNTHTRSTDAGQEGETCFVRAPDQQRAHAILMLSIVRTDYANDVQNTSFCVQSRVRRCGCSCAFIGSIKMQLTRPVSCSG